MDANTKEVLLAIIALLGSLISSFFAYLALRPAKKRGNNDSSNAKDNKPK